MKQTRTELGMAEVPGVKIMRGAEDVILMFDEVDEAADESKIVIVRLPISQAEAVHVGLGNALGKIN